MVTKMVAEKFSRIKNLQSNIVREHDLFTGKIEVSLNWIVTPSETNVFKIVKSNNGQ